MPMPLISVLGFLMLGFLMGIIVYPQVLYWAKKHIDAYRGGKCAYCGRETFVTPCDRCKTEVAFCHYYRILGTDVPGEGNLRGRRGSSVCTRCLTPEEERFLEAMLKR